MWYNLNFMKCILSILAFANLVFQEPTLSKVSIDNENVLNIISKYDSLIKVEGWDSSNNQALMIRIEKNDQDLIIYLDCTSQISMFENDVPDSYAEIEDRIIFIYDRQKVDEFESKRFQSFYNQFGNILIQDITPDGKYKDLAATQKVIHNKKWRAVYTQGKLEEVKLIYRFPSKKFFNNYQYNKEGYIIYKDGIFANTEVTPHQWEPNNFSLRKYILQNTSVPEYTLREGMVSAVLVIDENGKVIEAFIEGLDSKELVEEVKEALFNMPKWNPGEINGKLVKVRFKQRL